MQLLENFSLHHHNTFGVDVSCDFFIQVSSLNELREALRFAQVKQLKLLVIGGGSNVLLTRHFDGLVIKNALKGIEVENLPEGLVALKAAAGENWHELVMWCVERNFAGIENLSLIPGCVGAAPMQNIGAYGVELQDVFHELEAVEIETGNVVRFSKAQCKFGYRESVFKNEAKHKFVITSVTLLLSNLNGNHTYQVKTAYGDIQQQLENAGVTTPTISDVSAAVVAIRQSKLPNPAELGNAGSFFKNPYVAKEKFDALKVTFPQMPSYPVDEARVKVPAGWLIEQCGWKGKRIGNTGAHAKQALVLVNYGNANGSEVYELAKAIVNSVEEKFGIALEMEVNII